MPAVTTYFYCVYLIFVSYFSTEYVSQTYEGDENEWGGRDKERDSSLNITPDECYYDECGEMNEYRI